MPSNVYIPNELDPATLRWPPRCIYCGGPKLAEIPAKMRARNGKTAMIRIPYCTRHWREATRNKRIVNAALLGGIVVGLAVGMAILAGLAFLWRSGVDVPLIDRIESVIGAVVLASIVALFAVGLALRALSRFMPSLAHSQNPDGLLGLERVGTRWTFANDEFASDLRRLNPEITSSELWPPPVPRRVREHPSPDRPRAFLLPPQLLGGAAIALLVLLIGFLIAIFALQPR